MAEVQRLVGLASGGVPSLLTWQSGAGFYEALQTQLGFNNRYKRAYVVNPALQWSNDQIQVRCG